jgi:hypothetical protein
MTREEILAMKPGQELNMKVAKEVMGDIVVEDKTMGCVVRLTDEDGNVVWGQLQPYAEDVSAAELVVDKMIKLGYDDAVNWGDFGGGTYTEAEAICKAALLTISKLK